MVVTVLVVVFRQELAEAWSAGHPPDSAIKQPEFVPVVIVSYVVVAGLILTLVPFLRGGHNWARHSLGATVVFIGITTVAGLRTDPPAVFVVCAVRLAGLQRGAALPPLPPRHHGLRARPVRRRRRLTRLSSAIPARLDGLSGEGCTFEVVRTLVRTSPVGTTSTPVPAGTP